MIFLESRIDCKRGLILDGSGKDITISGHGLKLNVDNILYRYFQLLKSEMFFLHGRKECHQNIRRPYIFYYKNDLDYYFQT